MLYAKKALAPLWRQPATQSHVMWKGLVHRYIDQMPETFNEMKPRLRRLLHDGLHLELVKWTGELMVRFSDCNEADLYFQVAQLNAFFKKNEFIKPGDPTVDQERTARDIWLAAEAQCAQTNEAIISGLFLDPEYAVFVARMKAIIVNWIGVSPDLEDIYDACDFSSGASIGIHGDLTHVQRKATSTWSCTPGAGVHALRALRRSRYCSERLTVCELDGGFRVSECIAKLRVTSGNKLSFVPKTMETKRSIAVEPLMNSFVQSGIDRVLRDKLLRNAGIDLRDQTRNQYLAYLGSIDGSYATIDLSSASDTVSRMLVKELLPYEWHSLLNATRSPVTVDAEFGAVQLHKFCSMGNGFCFPLQTLIFAAMCVACGCTRGEYSVYGDDIIVPNRSGVVSDVLQWISRLGFTANLKKTFVSGSFRESCGADWMSGKQVRPAYVRSDWKDIRNVMSFHNTCLRLWPEHMHGLLCWLRSQVPVQSRFVRPSLDRDGNAFNAPLDEVMASRFSSWDRNTQNWKWREFFSTPSLDKTDYGPAGEFAALLRVVKSPEGNTFGGTKSRRRQTRTSTRVISRWPIKPISGFGGNE